MTPGEEAYQRYLAVREDPTLPTWAEVDDYAKRMWEIAGDVFVYYLPARQRAEGG